MAKISSDLMLQNNLSLTLLFVMTIYQETKKKDLDAFVDSTHSSSSSKQKYVLQFLA